MVGMTYQEGENGKTKVHFPRKFFRGEFRCDFFVSSRMKRVWAAQIEVLAEIDRICRKYDIRYFADGGTLLGAVRHKGFIPWDDDMDIAMKREDYNRFLEICADELDWKYTLYIPFISEGYKQPFAKVANDNGILKADSQEWCHDCGLFAGIDIFPLDYISRDRDAARIQEEMERLIYEVIRKMWKSESGEEKDTESAIISAVDSLEEAFALHFDRSKDLLKQLGAVYEGVCQLYTESEADEIYTISLLGQAGHPYKKEWYDETVLLDFETVKLPCPAAYEQVLTQEYGDYQEFVVNAANHDYPYYVKQIRDMERSFCENLCEYVRSGIARLFQSDRMAVEQLSVIKYSLKNCTLFFRLAGEEYTIRVVRSSYGEPLNRKAEMLIYELLKPYQITDECLWMQEDGSKISKYIKHSHPCDTENWDEVAECMEVLSFVHHLNVDIGYTFDFLEWIETFESLWGDTSYYLDYMETKRKIKELLEIIEKVEKAWGLTHFELSADNFLIGENEDGQTDIRLIDWEYAGMQDTHIDLAMFALKAGYSKKDLNKLINIYFNGRCSVEVRKKIYAYVSVCALFLSNYYEYYDRKGVEMRGDSLRYYPLAKEYYALVKGLDD